MMPLGVVNPPATGGGVWSRVDTNVEHLYLFDDGSGTTITDTGNSVTPADLIIPDLGKVTWSGTGLTITAATRIETAGAMLAFKNACEANGDSTAMEVWVTPANTTQNGPARIATISKDSSNTNRNITIGQGVSGSSGDRVEGRVHSIEGAGVSQSAVGTLSASLIHIVYTMGNEAGDNSARLYIDGAEVASTAATIFYAWSTSAKMAIAEEFATIGDRDWLGEYHLLALYSQRLTAAEVLQNYNAGPTGYV